MQSRRHALGGRLPLLVPEGMNPSQRETYDVLRKTFIPWAREQHFQSEVEGGALIGPFNSFLYSPAITAGFLQFMSSEATSTRLSKRVREVIILSIGAIWDAQFEVYAHSVVARNLGLSERTISALLEGRSSDELTSAERLAQRVVQSIHSERRVGEALYQEAEAAFGPEGLMDIMFLVGIYLFTSVVLNVFEVPAPGG